MLVKLAMYKNYKKITNFKVPNWFKLLYGRHYNSWFVFVYLLPHFNADYNQEQLILQAIYVS